MGGNCCEPGGALHLHLPAEGRELPLRLLRWHAGWCWPCWLLVRHLAVGHGHAMLRLRLPGCIAWLLLLLLGACSDHARHRLYHAQNDLGLEQRFGQLRVLRQDLARLAEVLLDQGLHLGQDVEQVRVRHLGQHRRGRILRWRLRGSHSSCHGHGGIVGSRVAHNLQAQQCHWRTPVVLGH